MHQEYELLPLSIRDAMRLLKERRPRIKSKRRRAIEWVVKLVRRGEPKRSIRKKMFSQAGRSVLVKQGR